LAVGVVAAYLVAASPLAGPAGLVPSSAAQFTVKTAMGALVAAGLVAPLVLDRPDENHRLLGSAPMVTLGRWSYGIFIWHLAALTMVFPVIGQFPFRGHMPEVLALTLVFSIAIAAVSYALVESPCREALRRWESRTKQPPSPEGGDAVSPRQEDAIAP
jgi:peptidoglycan/LPS O-acetylase OafA/YrhL